MKRLALLTLLLAGCTSGTPVGPDYKKPKLNDARCTYDVTADVWVCVTIKNPVR